jgi:hypothetical protein
MDEISRFELLERIGRRFDGQLRGKILQRLLEVAFHESGYRLVDERLSEGTDFDVMSRTQPAERYAFEVRTTIGFSVPVKIEDLRLLDERAADGYQTGLAAFRIAPGGCWVLIERGWLLPGLVRVALGTSRGWRDLARRVNDTFNDAVARYGEAVLRDGLDGLSRAVEEAKGR